MAVQSVNAGVARGEITPRLGVELGGYPYFDRPASGVHDPLVAGALYLESDDVRTLVIATDLFWITRPQATEVRNLVAEATGIPADNIFITCSHTHSAPWMSVVFKGFPGRPFETRVSDEYIETAIAECARVGIAAAASTFPAEVGVGLAKCGHDAGVGGNRRDPKNGPIDDDVPVLAVRDQNGTVRAIWTKYALHPTILHGENTLVSADFPWAMRQTVEAEYTEAVFLYSMGTAGDQSPRYYRDGQTFDEVERFGVTLGRSVLDAVASAKWTPSPRLGASSTAVDLVVKEYPAPEELDQKVADLKARHAALIAADAPYNEVQTTDLWILGAECDYMNAQAQREGELEPRYESGTPYSVYLLTVDDTAWVFLPGEIFCDFGLDIKRRSPYDVTHVVTLTNGHLPGYCVTQDALAEGGYEPGNSILDPKSGDVMADAAVALLNSARN